MIIYEDKLGDCNCAPDYFNNKGQQNGPALLGILSYGRPCGGRYLLRIGQNTDTVYLNAEGTTTAYGHDIFLHEDE